MGFLEEKQMSDVAKAADIWITKPGGSTTSEAHYMEKPVLFVLSESHKWEEKNGRLLKRVGLGKKFEPQLPIISQINDLIEHRKGSEQIQLKAYDWKNKVNSILSLSPTSA